eukprot:61617-Pleurochrysis_carterae.AAC.5
MEAEEGVYPRTFVDEENAGSDDGSEAEEDGREEADTNCVSSVRWVRAARFQRRPPLCSMGLPLMSVMPWPHCLAFIKSRPPSSFRLLHQKTRGSDESALPAVARNLTVEESDLGQKCHMLS